MKTAYFSIKNGEVFGKKAVKNVFNELKDGEYEIVITRKSKRSIQQNRYYFGVCVRMVQQGLKDTGYDVSLMETHDWLKAKFNYLEIVDHETGEYERIPRSTTELNKTDFGEYIGKIQQFAAEYLSIVIPDAGKQMAIEY